MGLRDIGATLPPGFRFYPNDEELVCHYLYKKRVYKLDYGFGGLIRVFFFFSFFKNAKITKSYQSNFHVINLNPGKKKKKNMFKAFKFIPLYQI